MRDFYDIYLIYTRDWDNINKDHFRKAIENTFKDYLEATLDLIKESNILKNKWDQYARRNEHCKEISYQMIISIVKIIKDNIYV